MNHRAWRKPHCAKRLHTATYTDSFTKCSNRGATRSEMTAALCSDHFATAAPHESDEAPNKNRHRS